MSELERFLVILAKRLDDNAYWENGPFGRAELAGYLRDAINETKAEIAAEAEFSADSGAAK